MDGFKEFLEIFDIMQSPTKGVDVFSWPQGHVYDFSVTFTDGGEPRKEKFTLNMLKAAGVHITPQKYLPLPETFKVFFSGPTGVQLSGTAGSAGSVVYRNILLGIKKMFEVQEQEGKPINALIFSAADPKMVPVYAKFSKTFLMPDPPQGMGFVQISSDSYLSKRWIRENKDRLSAEDYWEILRTARTMRDEIQRIKREKKQK